MANDVSYFRVEGDDTTYAFNDADLASAVATINAKIGNTSMGTTAATITGAIAEHESDITAINVKLSIGSVAQSDLLTDVLSELTFNTFYASGRDGATMWTVSITPGSTVSSGSALFTLQTGYRPWLASGNFLILPIRANTSPYAEAGTLWVGSDGTARCYGSLSAGTRYWVSCPAYLSY